MAAFFRGGKKMFDSQIADPKFLDTPYYFGWRPLIGGILLFLGLQSMVSATDPFDNWANPDGGYGVLYPLFYDSPRLTGKDGNTAVPSLGMHVYETIFRYVHYFNKNPKRSGLVNFLWPVARQDLLGRHDAGFGDPTLTAGIWLINEPQRHFYFATGVDVDVPLGRYDKNNPSSLGTNVWKFRPILAFAKFTPPVDVEVTLKYNISTENTDNGLKQGGQLQLGSYCGLFLSPRWLLGGHFNYITGGDDKVYGAVVRDSGVQKFQSGPNFQWLPSDRWSVMFEILRDFSTRNTTEGTLFLSRIAYKI